MNSNHKKLVFLPSWVQTQVERAGLDHSAYTSFAKLRQVCSEQDIYSIVALTDEMYIKLGIMPWAPVVDKSGELKRPYNGMMPSVDAIGHIETMDASKYFQGLSAYYKLAYEDLRSSIFLQPNETPRGGEKDGYVIRDLDKEHLYITILPHYFGLGVNTPNVAHLRRDLLKKMSQYVPYHDLVDTRLYTTYFDTL
jgi:hypothetical protein